jgi:hypothetical protein
MRTTHYLRFTAVAFALFGTYPAWSHEKRLSEASSETLQVQGRALLDTCGNPLVIRGVEQPMASSFSAYDPDNDPEGENASLEETIHQISLTGANAVRLLFDVTGGEDGENPTWRIEQLVEAAVSSNLVVYLTGGGYDWEPDPDGTYRSSYRAWFASEDMRALVDRFKRWIIIDVGVESSADTREIWRDASIEDVQYFRDMGYTVPFTVIGPTAGRDLPAILQYGAEIEAADPLGKTILGWQAYWGSSHWWQYAFGGEEGLSYPSSIRDGVEVISRSPFPIQVGLDFRSDPNEITEYQSGMSAAAETNTGWLWWAYYHPIEWPVWRNGLTQYGTLSHLYDTEQDPYGPTVVYEHPNALISAVRACGA